MTEPTILDPAIYWKLKTVMTESRLLELQIRDLLRTQEQKVKAIMAEASLDSITDYNLNDLTFTATPVEKA